ncbi:hypothetical protein J6590_012513 [Homalodisca vitripennis]|nr:hypothetical protein J6590_012513 [Homalodisca vitripennis]
MCVIIGEPTQLICCYARQSQRHMSMCFMIGEPTQLICCFAPSESASHETLTRIRGMESVELYEYKPLSARLCSVRLFSRRVDAIFSQVCWGWLGDGEGVGVDVIL